MGDFGLCGSASRIKCLGFCFFSNRGESKLQINACTLVLPALQRRPFFLWLRPLCTSVLGSAKAISGFQTVPNGSISSISSNVSAAVSVLWNLWDDPAGFQDTSTIACSACEIGLHSRDPCRGWGVVGRCAPRAVG